MIEFTDILLDALLDTAKMVPFLFVAYLVSELLEQGKLGSVRRLLSGSRWSPVVGAGLGILPQCGFSAAIANLYNRSAVSAGTLLAVFIATSDEALPMLLARPESYGLLVQLLIIKLLLAVVCGLLLDLLLRRRLIDPPEPPEDHCECEHHGHHHGGVLLPALRHTVSITLFIFVVTLVLGGALAVAGEETIASVLMTGSLWQPFIAALVGFIPNCASSVIITGLLIEGSLSLGAAVAGLTTGAGAGMLVLIRGSRSRRDLVRFLILLYAIGVVAGVVVDLL